VLQVQRSNHQSPPLALFTAHFHSSIILSPRFLLNLTPTPTILSHA